MTEERLFFDTDCISAFLWANDTSLVTALYGGGIAIPTQVYEEISSCVTIPHIKARIDLLIDRGQAIVVDLDITGGEYALYRELAITPPKGEMVIGKGEAACIAMAKERDGVLASNNLRDISKYIERFGLKHITTGDIICEAFEKGLIDETGAEELWAKMIAKRRRLGAATFAEFRAKMAK